jgi:hypothetical protein
MIASSVIEAVINMPYKCWLTPSVEEPAKGKDRSRLPPELAIDPWDKE